VDKDPKIPEDDWKKKWKPGTYDYLDPEYKPGTHEVERGNVTWHQLKTTGNVRMSRRISPCTSPEKTDTEIWLTNTVSGLTRTLHFIQGRNPA